MTAVAAASFWCGLKPNGTATRELQIRGGPAQRYMRRRHHRAAKVGREHDGRNRTRPRTRMYRPVYRAPHDHMRFSSAVRWFAIWTPSWPDVVPPSPACGLSTSPALCVAAGERARGAWERERYPAKRRRAACARGRVGERASRFSAARGDGGAANGRRRRPAACTVTTLEAMFPSYIPKRKSQRAASCSTEPTASPARRRAWARSYASCFEPTANGSRSPPALASRGDPRRRQSPARSLADRCRFVTSKSPSAVGISSASVTTRQPTFQPAFPLPCARVQPTASAEPGRWGRR